MLRKTETPIDIELIQKLSSDAFVGVVKILEDVNQAYKKLLKNTQEEEKGLIMLYKMGFKNEVGDFVKLFDSLKRVQKHTDLELRRMKRILEDSK